MLLRLGDTMASILCAGMSPPGLAGARYVIASEYGYSSWQNLQRHFVDVARKGALRSESNTIIAALSVKPPIQARLEFLKFGI